MSRFNITKRFIAQRLVRIAPTKAPEMSAMSGKPQNTIRQDRNEIKIHGSNSEEEEELDLDGMQRFLGLIEDDTTP